MVKLKVAYLQKNYTSATELTDSKKCKPTVATIGQVRVSHG